MTTYIVTEKQNVASTRKGAVIEAENLSAAKRKASSMQMFKGTVMMIEAENGALLSVKEDGKWEDRF